MNDKNRNRTTDHSSSFDFSKSNSRISVVLFSVVLLSFAVAIVVATVVITLVELPFIIAKRLYGAPSVSYIVLKRRDQDIPPPRQTIL